MGFFSKKKKDPPKKKINYNFARALIAASIITIGEDKEVSDRELQSMQSQMSGYNIPMDEYNSIMEELQQHLSSKGQKIKLLSNIESSLTKEEKIKVFRLCCRIALSDDRILITEMALLEEIAVIMEIPADYMSLIIEEEQHIHNADH